MANVDDKSDSSDAGDGSAWLTEVSAWNTLLPVASETLQAALVIISSCAFITICLLSAFARLSAKRVSNRVELDSASEEPASASAVKKSLQSRLFLFKMGLLIAFFICCFVRICLVLVDERTLGATIAGDFLEFFCLLVALLKMHKYQRDCMHSPSSGSLFALFFMLTICHAVRSYSSIVRQNADDQSKNGAMISVGVPERRLLYVELLLLTFSLILLISSCFADRQNVDPKQSPLATISFASFMTFSWVFTLVYNGWRRSLDFSDLWHLPKEFLTCSVSQRFEFYWAREQQKRRSPSLARTLYHMVSFKLWLGAALRLLMVLVMFCSPILLKLLLQSVAAEGKSSSWKSFAYAVGLFCISMLSTLFQNQFFRIQYEFAVTFRSALTVALYKKLYRLSNTSRAARTAGEMINFLSVDVQRVVDMCLLTFVPVMIPPSIVLALWLLWNELGPSSLVGIVVLLIFFPLNAAAGAIQHRLYFSQLQWKDKRMAFMSEILNGIKVLKLYAWERPFMQRVMQCRQHEVHRLRQQSLLDTVGSVAWEMTPLIMAITCFTGYVFWTTGNNPAEILTAERIFVSMALFQMLTVPIALVPNTITALVQCRIALKRLTQFLTCDEAETNRKLYLNGGDVAAEYEKQKPIEFKRDVAQNGPVSAAEAEAREISSSPVAVRVGNGTFFWGRSSNEASTPILRDIELDLPVGSLTAVVGVVGAGKSSLCSAVLDLMDKSSITMVEVSGRLAYAPQQPWIRNATVKQNILFSTTDEAEVISLPFDAEHYERVLDACALRSDLGMLPSGDATMIGEKGVNLSGGQKQRISLARAAYSDADVVILDDPLSAVDAHVAQHLFQQLISNETGLLKHRTRLLVTHSLSVLPHVDTIIVLDQGRIVDRGTYEQLRESGRWMQVIASLTKISEEEEQKKEKPAVVVNRSLSAGPATSDKKLSLNTPSMINEDDVEVKTRLLSTNSIELTPSPGPQGVVVDLVRPSAINRSRSAQERTSEVQEQEEAQSGNISSKVYLLYAKLMSYKLCALCLTAFVSYEAFIVLSQLWLARWAAQADTYLASTNLSRDFDSFAWQKQQLAVYAGLGVIVGVFFTLSCIMLTICTVRAMYRLHARMLERIMHAPVQFFDRTPLGRIVNRFSRDIDAIDNDVPQRIRPMLQIAMQLCGILFLICYGTPIFTVVGVVLFIAFIFIQRFYVCTSRQLKRIESLKKSPIFSHFSETIQGMAVIKVMQKQNDFERQFERLIDAANVPYFYWFYADRWVFLTLSTLSAFVVFFASIFVLVARDLITPSMMGLVISNALSFAAPMQWFVRYLSDLEANIVAVERVKFYMDHVPQERAWEVSNATFDDVRAARWPEYGRINFHKYSTRYRADLPCVLNEIDFEIKSCEKVGIAGRTGSGKSSLALALFRIIESAAATATNGRIEIDGLDISQIGLHDLRKRLLIIPQEPVLFSGTLRFNMDPEESFTDEQIVDALHHAHLGHLVEVTGLDFTVAEDGQNLSVGQRQLVSLARALLRRPRREKAERSTVLVLDEATAAVDAETDELIQQTIRREFADATVLTIAHRLHTILDCDRVMIVGDGGKVREFDSPAVLLQNGDSELSRMVRAAAL